MELMLIFHILYIADKVNTNKPWTTKTSHAPVQQINKWPIAKIQETTHHVWKWWVAMLH